MTSIDGIVPERPQLFDAMRHTAMTERELAREMRAEGGEYPYKTHIGRTVLETGPYEPSHPFLEFATGHRLLNLVNAYLGMHACLYMIQLSWNYPYSEDAHGAYLWHKDSDDRNILKVFVYFNDVDDGSGPFSFIPATHPMGRLGREQPVTDAHYIDDGLMSEVISDSKWRRVSGTEGTVIIADTRGFHRAAKPVLGERLALLCVYTSGRPVNKPLPILVGHMTVRGPAVRWALAR